MTSSAAHHDPANNITADQTAPRSRNIVRPLPVNISVITPALGDQLSVSQTRYIVDVLRRGGVVWFYSDCSYAIGVDPRHPTGIRALDALLDHAGHPIPLTAADETLAATLIRFDVRVRALTAKFWPGGLGIHTKPISRLARRIAKNVHGTDGVVVRVSQSVIERQISATARLPITSAAVRDRNGLVTDPEYALDLALHLTEERTPGVTTIFIRDPRKKPRLRAHSTMISVGKQNLTVLRHGSVDVHDAQRAALSNHGVDWSDAT